MSDGLIATVGTLASVVGVLIVAAVLFLRWYWGRRLTWDSAFHVAGKLLADIEASNWSPDIVIGLGRSGGIWGDWLAGNLGGKRFTVVDDRYEETAEGVRVTFPDGAGVLSAVKGSSGGKPLRVLVIEGASSTGQTPMAFQQQFQDELRAWDVRFAVLYANHTSAARLDYVGLRGPERWPSTFPWHTRPSYRPYLRDVISLAKASQAQ